MAKEFSRVIRVKNMAKARKKNHLNWSSRESFISINKCIKTIYKCNSLTKQLLSLSQYN